jgi:aminocarboxymuconate-semialdehyde decarboxylase
MDPHRRALLHALGLVGVAAKSQATAPSHTRDRGDRSPPEQPARESTEPKPAPTPPKAKVIDVHTHMYGRTWLTALKAAGDRDVRVQPGPKGDHIVYRWAGVGTLGPEFYDWDTRIQMMDAAGVDIAVISLSAPNVHWGSKAVSAKAARDINDEFAAAQSKYDGRIRWMASLPWSDATNAVAELRRAKQKGAIGVCTLTNILGVPLTDERFRPIWTEIEAMRLPAFVHPTLPFNDGMGLNIPALANAVGFTSETTLCFARMMVEGFLDAFPQLQLIACHGGGALPYLATRVDRCWDRMIADKKNREAPSGYLKRLYFDSIVYDLPTLQYLLRTVGEDRVLYGSDYPFSLGDMPGILARVDELPAAQRNKIRSSNARKLFEL